MKDKLELTKELENEAMENPIRQNHDYGGDFLNKIRERNKRRKQRKEAMPKFAQEREQALFSVGDRVTISAPIEGEVNRVGTVKQILRPSQWGGNKFLYKVEVDVDGKKETFSIQESAIRPPDEAPEHDKFKTGDQVKILRDEGYEPLDAVVVGVGDRDFSGRVLKYTVRFQYDGKWYKRNAETARLIANPNGHVPLSDGSPDEYADAPDSIREEMSSAHEDISLKPAYSDSHGYFVFPNYEYGVYASENDNFVKYLNDENIYYVVNLFKSTKGKELIPVVRDAVIFAINAKQPDKLISPGLYDYIKENYPKYWANAINKVVIEDRRLYAIPDGKHEEVYDNFKEQILPIIFSYKERSFRDLFLDPYAPGTKGDFRFLLDRLLAGNAPEFQAYLGANLDKLSGSFLFRTKIYTLFPEETKEKILKYLEHLGKDRPESFIEASYYIPEAVDFLRKIIETDFKSIFESAAIDFLERFSPEERQTFYPLLLNNKPSDVFHAIVFHAIEFAETSARDKETREAVSQIISEVPQNIWDRMAVKSFKDDAVYFFTIDVMKFVPFSENIIKIGYYYILNNIRGIEYNFKKLFANEQFNNLIAKYGLTEQQFLNIYKEFNGKEIANAHALSSLLQNYTSSVAQKVKENQDLSPADIEFIFKYFENELYKADSNGYQNLNTLLSTAQAKEWGLRGQTKGSLHNGSALLSYIHKAKEPFLSEAAFYNLMRIVSGKNVLRNNYGPDKAFTDWMPMSKLVGEPSDQLLRFYSEIMATEKPSHLFKSSGKEKINLFSYFADENLEDEELMRYLSGLSPENIREFKEKDPEGFEKLVESSREKIREERKSLVGDKQLLIQRYPDLLLPAINNMTFNPYLLDNELLRYIRLIYLDVNDIPEPVADLVFAKTLQGNGSIPTLYRPNEYKLIKILKEKFPQKYDKIIRKTARMAPGLFLNSPFGRDRANYGQEILDAIENLNRRDFQTWDNQEDTLGEEFKKFVYQPGNEDLIKALIDKADEIDEIESLLNLWPDLADKAKDQGIKILPVAALRNVEDLETAKSMYKALKNDYPVEGLPDEIKISKSIYQLEQRPYVLENETRYTISNNNIDPTPVLYDIGKKLVHDGDGVVHTNVGVSGFTNSWALVSFIKVQEEENDDFQDTILIEQYQSDYPPVLFHLFSGKGYGTGKDALQKLIRRYGDQEAIQKYIEEIELASNIDPEEIELPIELAPMVKDARTHFEYISKAYPYLAIANTIKTAQALNLPNIYIFADAARYANIENEDKAYKLYEAIPEALGEKIHDHNCGLDMWRIPATDETLEKLYAMTQEATGKSKDYNFSLTPSQNQEQEHKRREEERQKKKQWSATPEKEKKLNDLERKIREMLPMIEVPNFYSPQQALRFLGDEVRGQVVPKKQFNRQFGIIMRDLGILSRAARRRKRMIKLATLIRKYAAEWQNGTPSFDWLNNGMIGDMAHRYPEAFNEFLDLNSDKFVEWDPVKYLGSGKVGDAWLLSDGRILKIFDSGATVYNKTDSKKYEEIMEAQHEGTADPNLPMIYEHGLLKVPSEFYYFRSPSSLNYGGYYRPGYVIMERVDTPNDLTQKYIDYNPYLLEPAFVYDEEADDWTEREYVEGKEIPPISKEEVPDWLQDLYQDALMEGKYDEFIKEFVNRIFDYIISDMYLVYENAKEEFDQEVDSLYDDEELSEDILDFREPDIADTLIDMMTDAIEYSEYYDDKTLGALERILNLPQGWEKQLATSITNNALRGRHDLHGANFGFRNNKAVFFDA